MALKFALKQHVIVPGHAPAQGRVLDFTETLPGFPVYTLRYLSPEGEPLTGTVGEGDLAAANLTDEQIMQEVSAEAEAEKHFQRHVLAEVNRRLRAARHTRASLRNRKAAHKRKR